MSAERIGDDVRVTPRGPLRASIRPPGSKSITNRELAMASLADGESTLRGASLSDDALAMLEGLRALGVAIDLDPPLAAIHVRGCHGHYSRDEAILDVGAAGTAMRFLAALACLGHGRFTIDGSPRMRQRPIGGLVDALTAIGAAIGDERQPGFPPLTILGRGLAGGMVSIGGVPSSQFLSALLMAAPYATNDVLMRVDGPIPSEPYLDLTIHAMRQRGVDVLSHSGRFIVPSHQRYQAMDVDIEPDASSATYFWAAAAIAGGSVRVEGIRPDSLQADAGFTGVLVRMGCHVEADEGGTTVHGPPAGELTGIDIDMNAMPDAVQTLAAAALFARGPTTIRNVANLRVKETDRLAALRSELEKLGPMVEERADGLTIHPTATMRGASIDTQDDHRMAMSLALVGLRVEGIVIRNARCVGKSYPDYFDDLNRLSTAAR